MSLAIIVLHLSEGISQFHIYLVKSLAMPLTIVYYSRLSTF